MGNEVRYDTFWIRREGQQILIDSACYHDDSPFYPELILRLTEDGGIVIDPDWQQQEAAKTQHQQTWRNLIERLNLGYTIGHPLYRAAPPRFITEEAEHIEYLRAIANGEIKVEGFGMKGRELLTQALRITFPRRKT